MKTLKQTIGWFVILCAVANCITSIINAANQLNVYNNAEYVASGTSTCAFRIILAILLCATIVTFAIFWFFDKLPQIKMKKAAKVVCLSICVLFMCCLFAYYLSGNITSLNSYDSLIYAYSGIMSKVSMVDVFYLDKLVKIYRAMKGSTIALVCTQSLLIAGIVAMIVFEIISLLKRNAQTKTLNID